MMKKSRWLLKIAGLGLLIAGVVAGLLWWKGQFAAGGWAKWQDPVNDHRKVRVAIGRNTYQIELVNTPGSTAQGLSGRDEIGADGMLFLFPQAVKPRFWMKDMKFDLDLVWILDGEVIEVTPNVPKPGAETSLTKLPIYVPTQPVNMVLEVPAGQAATKGIKPGVKLVPKDD